MATIRMTQEVEITPEVLAKMFSELDGLDQAKFFNEVDFIFHSWAGDGYDVQTYHIRSNMANGTIFIRKLAQE